MKTIRILILAVSLAAISMPAFAQRQMPGPLPDDVREEEPDADVGPGRGSPPSEEKREEIRKRIEAVRIWRLTEELKLDEKTAGKFFPVISTLNQKRVDLMRESIHFTQELRLYLQSAKPDEKKLKLALEKLEKNHEELMKIQEKEIEATKDYLTVEQQARYFLFHQDFQREMRGMISGVRGGTGRGRMGPGPGQGVERGPLPGRQGGPPDDESRSDMPPPSQRGR